MTGHPGVSAVLNKDLRIDSGAALSDTGVPISDQFSNRKLQMSESRHTRYDFSAAKAHYREDELQLRQPEGFPIIPLPITVARAFKEAEEAAAARDCAEPEFDIYVDADNGTCNTTVCENMINTESGAILGDKEEDDNNQNENEQASNENGHKALPGAVNVAKDGRNSDVAVDTLGRTRAATNRRKALETLEITDSLGGVEEEGNSKKRRRGNAGRSAQPRKRSARSSH